MRHSSLFQHSFVLAAVFAVCAIAASAEDLKIKKTITASGASFSQETYVKGARERNVMQLPGAGSTVTIRQCDLKRTLTLNDAARTYLVASDPQDDSVARAAALAGGMPAPQQGGSVSYRITSTDTGEHKEMFGFDARHVKTVIETEPSPGACSATKSKFEIDGWYIDLEEQAACQRISSLASQASSASGCQDRISVQQSGNGKMGFPLAETIHMRNGNDPPVQMTNEVTELTRGALAAELFDVPSGYRQVSTLAELYAVPMPSAAAQTAPGAAPAAAANYSAVPSQAAAAAAGSPAMGMVPQAMMAPMMGMAMAGEAAGQEMPGTPAQGGAAVPAPAAVGPKAPGRIRIGVVPARAQLGQGMNAQMDYATPIRNAIIQMMSGPAVEVVPLDARIPVQIDGEARQKECDFVLSSEVTVKRGGGFGFGKVMSMAGPVASMGSLAGAAGSMSGAIAATAAASALTSVSGFTSQIKNKDDVTFEYQLVQVGQQSPRLNKTLKAKAKSDGEDVLTPLIEESAGAVLTEVTTKK